MDMVDYWDIFFKMIGCGRRRLELHLRSIIILGLAPNYSYFIRKLEETSLLDIETPKLSHA